MCRYSVLLLILVATLSFADEMQDCECAPQADVSPSGVLYQCGTPITDCDISEDKKYCEFKEKNKICGWAERPELCADFIVNSWDEPCQRHEFGNDIFCVGVMNNRACGFTGVTKVVPHGNIKMVAGCSKVLFCGRSNCGYRVVTTEGGTPVESETIWIPCNTVIKLSDKPVKIEKITPETNFTPANQEQINFLNAD